MTAAAGYLILYGDQRQHRCLVLERGRAEQTAANLHGVLVPLVVPEEFRHLLTASPGNPASSPNASTGAGRDSVHRHHT